MRPIDADELLRELNSLGQVQDWRFTEDPCWYVRSVRKTIQRQPTAYDVEKVVEKLKEEAAYEHCPETGCDYLVIELDDAIEIVKAGGRE